MQKSNRHLIHFIPEYLDYLEVEQGLSPKTAENYYRFLKKFQIWLEDCDLSDLRPHELTSEHIYEYKSFLAHEGSSTKPSSSPAKPILKKTTQNYYIIALRNLLKYLADRDVQSLPSDKAKLLRDKEDHQINYLKLDQLEILLSSPNTNSPIGLRDRVLLETLFSTGLRVAELVALDREQIKIKNLTEYLEISIKGKGGRIRTVYFSQRAVFWLKKYLNSRKDIDKALFISYSKNSPENEDKRLSVRSVENIVKKYVKIAGLPIMTSPHSLRHSYATDLLTNGVDLRLVQEFLGHRNIATTQIYTHVTNKQLRDVHRKFHSGAKMKQ
ncbi:MAG: tyrosine-type recombinase/integrase [bacterium]|nr:tyrosine-type recombinase/integrase [bacterium]